MLGLSNCEVNIEQTNHVMILIALEDKDPFMYYVVCLDVSLMFEVESVIALKT